MMVPNMDLLINIIKDFTRIYQLELNADNARSMMQL